MKDDIAIRFSRKTDLPVIQLDHIWQKDLLTILIRLAVLYKNVKVKGHKCFGREEASLVTRVCTGQSVPTGEGKWYRRAGGVLSYVYLGTESVAWIAHHKEAFKARHHLPIMEEKSR